MGAEPYWYFVEYKPDIEEALQELREREFKAGRYNPVMPDLFSLFPIGPNSPTPGAQHDSIIEAFADTDADGTRSILDIQGIAEERNFCVAAPLEDEMLQSLYGTTQPTHQMIEQNMDFFEDLERGHGIYIIVFKDGKPNEIFFAGYSFD
jgi:hypothetical protein